MCFVIKRDVLFLIKVLVAPNAICGSLFTINLFVSLQFPFIIIIFMLLLLNLVTNTKLLWINLIVFWKKDLFI